MLQVELQRSKSSLLMKGEMVTHQLDCAVAELARDTEQRKAALTAKIDQTARPELSDLLLGRMPGRRTDRDITLFLNYAGLGYQFAATGHVIYTKARERGLGRELDTDLFTSALPS